MAAPRPQEHRSRARDDARRQAEFEHRVEDGSVLGPELPDAAEFLPKDDAWHPATVNWWETWRQSAQAQEFTTTDWNFLLDTALLHHEMWARGKWEFAGEVRLRAAKFGATPEDRRRLKLRVETGNEHSETEANRPMTSARKRDLKVV